MLLSNQVGYSGKASQKVTSILGKANEIFGTDFFSTP